LSTTVGPSSGKWSDEYGFEPNDLPVLSAHQLPRSLAQPSG